MNSFLSEMYDAFKRTNGFVLGALAFVLAFAFWIWTPDYSVSLKIVLPGSTILIIGCIVLFDCAYTLHKRDWSAPRVVRVSQPPEVYKANGVLLLLLEKSEMFGQDHFVSIYERRDDFELLLGLGLVINVQQSGLLQVLVLGKDGAPQNPLWESALSNDPKVLARLLVKPGFSKTQYLTQVQE
jgi:hypothetical protein